MQDVCIFSETKRKFDYKYLPTAPIKKIQIIQGESLFMKLWRDKFSFPFFFNANFFLCIRNTVFFLLKSVSIVCDHTIVIDIDSIHVYYTFSTKYTPMIEMSICMIESNFTVQIILSHGSSSICTYRSTRKTITEDCSK